MTTTAKKPTQTLPKNIETHINNNTTFNKFGIINLNALRASTKTQLNNTELKKLIRKRFASEMADGKIEFLTKKLK